MRMIRTMIMFSIIMFTTISMATSCNNGQEGRIKNFQTQLGTYVFDVRKTALGNYSKDSNLYKNLFITFNADSTFSMNMRVPFMYDSLGKWKAGNMSEWNYIWYEKWGYKDYENGRGNQFTRPYVAEDSNEYFLINGATPQEGADIIPEIYFRKVSP